jgi:hypothetical protein
MFWAEANCSRSLASWAASARKKATMTSLIYAPVPELGYLCCSLLFSDLTPCIRSER